MRREGFEPPTSCVWSYAIIRCHTQVLHQTELPPLLVSSTNFLYVFIFHLKYHIICLDSLFRRPLGHWFKSNLCKKLAEMLLLILLYATYLYTSSKKGVVLMLISSVLYILTCLGTNGVAQSAEQGVF